jgi:hypothetical protein
VTNPATWPNRSVKWYHWTSTGSSQIQSPEGHAPDDTEKVQQAFLLARKATR